MSTLRCSTLKYWHQFSDSAMSDDHSVEEKLDLLLKSVPTLSNKQDALADRHDASQRELNSSWRKMSQQPRRTQQSMHSKGARGTAPTSLNRKATRNNSTLTKEWKTELMWQQRGSRGWLHLRGTGKPYRRLLMNYKKVWTLLLKGRSIFV